MFTSDGGFTKPESVTEVAVELECPTTMLPSENTPSDLIKTELFVKGHERLSMSVSAVAAVFFGNGVRGVKAHTFAA